MASAAKGKKKKEYTFKFLNNFMLIQLALILAVCLYITVAISNRAKKSATEHLSAIGTEHATIIDDYVSNNETILNSFAGSPQFVQVLQKETGGSATEQLEIAQKYVVEYAKDIPGLEGLYVCDWDSKTILHSNAETVGKVIRTDDRLASLHDSLKQAGTAVYNDGMLISPNSGKQVISLYRAIYDMEGNPLGFAGLAVDTNALLEKLKNIETPGLTTSFFSMLDVQKNVYVFDDVEAAGTEVTQPDLLQTCNDVRGKTEKVSGTYEYKAGKKKVVGTYEYMPGRQWVLLMNADKREVYKLVNAMQMFMAVFTILMIAMMMLFSYLNKKQARVNERLLSSIDKIKETKQSLTSAMYNDVLTDVGNRIKFSIDVSAVEDAKTNPYYFALFNIIDFSSINTAFGNDAGDSLLERTGVVLKEKFKATDIYRTGSDEFVVMLKTENGAPRQEFVIDDVSECLRKLTLPQEVPGVGTIYPKYRVAVIKRNSDIDTSVVTVMKEMTKIKGEAMPGMIDFSDLTDPQI